MQRRYLISSLVCAMTTLGLASPAVAQGTYPDHPVKVIVALPAGGSVDMIARVMSCLLYTSPSPRDLSTSRMPSSA